MAITDVEEAIKALLDGDQTYAGLGLVTYSGRVPKDTPYPYVSMMSPLDARIGRTSDSFYNWQQVQLQAYSQDKGEAAKCADAIKNALNDDVDLSQFVAGFNYMEIQHGNTLYNQVEDAVWCYTVLFNVKYRTARNPTPAT